MKRFAILLMSTVVMATAVSCKKKKKDEDGPAAQVSKMLIGTKWKITAQTVSPAIDYNGDGIGDSNLFALKEECAQDDCILFSEGGAFQFFDSGKKCTEESFAPGIWVLYNNDKSLRITDQDGSLETEIVTINSNTLVYKYTEFIGGKTVVITETRVKS